MANFVLSQSDRDDVAAMLKEWRDRRGNVPLQSGPLRDIHQAPEHYIAKPQSAGGLPALVRGTGGNPDKAGVGTCDIYRITLSGGDAEIIQISSLTKEVYNISEAIVAQDWIDITRSKAGKYLTKTASAGAWIATADINEPNPPGTATLSINSGDTLDFEGDDGQAFLSRDASGDIVAGDSGGLDAQTPLGIATRTHTDASGNKKVQTSTNDEVAVCVKLLALTDGTITHDDDPPSAPWNGTIIFFDDNTALATFGMDAGRGINLNGTVTGEVQISLNANADIPLDTDTGSAPNVQVGVDTAGDRTLSLRGGVGMETVGSTGSSRVTFNNRTKFLIDVVGTGTAGDFVDFSQHTNPGTIELIGSADIDIAADVANGTITFSFVSAPFTNFKLAGDTGVTQTITNSNTLRVLGGTGITTVGTNLDRVVANLDRPPFQVRLSSILEPGSSSPANFLVWNVATSAYDATGAQLTVWDTHFRNFGFSGDTFDVVLDPDSARYEVKGSQLPTLTVKTDTTITAGTQGVVSVWKDDVDSGLNLSAWLDWAVRTGEDVSAGKEGVITYRPDWRRWDLTILECEDDDVNIFEQMYSFIA